MPSAQAKTAQRTISSMLSHIKAANARFDAECASKLSLSDLGVAEIALQPAFELSKSLAKRKSLEPDEALVHLREAGLCDLLLSLLRRWPYKESLLVTHLALLPGLLSALHAFLHVAERVDRSKRAAVYAAMCKRCTYGSLPVQSLAVLRSYPLWSLSMGQPGLLDAWQH